MDLVKDMILEFVIGNAQLIAVIIGGLVAVAMALGSAKKMLGKLLSASLQAGEAAAAKLIEKPKAVALALALFALLVGAGWAWHTFSAPKVVIKEVPVTVTDNQMIDHLRAQLAGMASEKAASEARAASLENQVSGLQAASRSAAEAKEKAEEEAAALERKVADMSPSGDQANLDRLMNSFDRIHATGVGDEVTVLQKRKQSTLRYVNEGRGWYHRNCRVCESNFRIETEAETLRGRIYHAEKVAREEREAEQNRQAGALRQEREDRLAAIRAKMDFPHMKEAIQQSGHSNDMEYYQHEGWKVTQPYHKDCETCVRNRNGEDEHMAVRQNRKIEPAYRVEGPRK